ncbi:hypothetical protein AAF712_005519 [Marasmius tenuissimus]|uniref:Questin oxidase n=1 Tax=Marasmius tenuissimus TaxID=585030 RepID=A0ABR3A1L0_9AGAR|nr:hypothetical protein PM082_017182 [Marasmius tenuissimus]
MSSNIDFFPSPSKVLQASPNDSSPAIFPGVTSESTEALKATLRENHEKYHVFFNDLRFVKRVHLGHRALAIWALGAGKDLIQKTFNNDSKYQKPRGATPQPITRENFNEHLGDPKYYDGYLEYFASLVRAGKTPSQLLEEYIFSSAMNTPNGAGNNPQMISRFLDGVFHSMIWTGYGIEFGLPGVIAEGLAQCAVYTSQLNPIISGCFSSITKSEFESMHAFSVIARISEDDNVRIPPADARDLANALKFVLQNSTDGILRHVVTWSNFADSEIDRKMEEVVWTNALIYASCGFKFRGREEFNADFFEMHAVTSSLFLPIILPVLSPASQKLLLRTYFATSLSVWTVRGKPLLDICSLFATPVPTPVPSVSVTTTARENGHSSRVNPLPSPWLDLLNHGVVHPDDHLVKIQDFGSLRLALRLYEGG